MNDPNLASSSYSSSRSNYSAESSSSGNLSPTSSYPANLSPTNSSTDNLSPTNLSPTSSSIANSTDLESWSINIADSQQLSLISKILDLLESNISNKKLPFLLNEFLSPLIKDEDQMQDVITSIFEDVKYRESFISGMNKSIDLYIYSFQNLPQEIIWQILSELDIVSLRALYNTSNFMRNVMNDNRFL